MTEDTPTGREPVVDPISGRPLHEFVLPTVVSRQTTRYLPPREAPPAPKPPHTKYVELAVLLARLDRDTTTFTFDQIDRLVGGLPPSAHRHRSWWANTRQSPQGRAWKRVAWTVAELNLDREVVGFERDPLSEDPGFSAGYAPHWIQVKQASKAVKSWRPGEVTLQSGEAADVRFSTETVTYWCRLFRKIDPPAMGERVWVNTEFHLMAVPHEEGKQTFSVSQLALRIESDAVPYEDLYPGTRPTSFGLTVQDFAELTAADRRRALALIGQELSLMIQDGEQVDLQDAIWRVGEYEFGGNGDRWVNSWEVQDCLSEIAEPLLASGSEGHFIHYSEYLDLIELGPGLCFVAFEPIEPDDWHFVEQVEREDVSRITELALEAYRFGKNGDGDPHIPYDWIEVHPPLREEDFASAREQPLD